MTDRICATYRPIPMADFTSSVQVEQGASLDVIVNRFGPKGNVVVRVAGHAVPREKWHLVRPKAPVVIMGVPDGPALALVPALLATVAGSTIASSAAVIAAVGATGAAVLGAAASVAIGVVGSLAINALFRPGTQQQRVSDGVQRGEFYQIGASNNPLDPNGTIPILMGAGVRHYPKFMAIPFSDSVGNASFVNMAFVHGTGPIRLVDFRIGETPLSRFEGVFQQVVEDFSDQSQQRTYSRDLVPEAVAITLLPQEQHFRVTAENTIGVTLEFIARNGLYFLENDGSVSKRNQAVDLAYRAVGTSTWLPMPSFLMRSRGTLPIQGAPPLFRFPAAGQYEIRVTRQPYNFEGAGTTRSQDTIEWVQLRSYQQGAAFYPLTPVTASFLRLKATQQLNGVPETINAVGYSRCLAFNPATQTWVPDVETSNPGDLVRYAMQHEDLKNPVPDSEIDLDSIQRFSTYCIQKGWTFKGYIDGALSLKDRVDDIAAAGRGRHVYINGKHGVIWDEEITLPVQHFTPDNSSGFSSEIVYDRPLHGLRVRFNDETNDFNEQFRTVYADGFNAANATNIEEIEFPGVTSPDNIYKFARYYIAEVALRREQFTFTTNWQHLACKVGSLIQFAHDTLLIGTAQGRFKAVNGLDVTLQDPVTLEAGKTYTIRWRSQGNVSRTASIANGPGTYTTVTLANETGAPAGGEIYMLGETGRESIQLKVKEIIPSADLEATLVCVAAAPAIYAADTGVIPEFDPVITSLPDPKDFIPTNFRAREDIVRIDGQTRSRVRFWWNPPTNGQAASYEVSEVIDGETSDPLVAVPGDQTEAAVFDLEAGVYTFRLTAAIKGAGVSSRATDLRISLTKTREAPPDPTNATLTVADRVLTLMVDRATDLLAQRLSVRVAPLGTQRTWESAVPVAEGSEGNTVVLNSAPGVYYVKWVSPYGVESAQAASVIVTSPGLDDFNVVETIQMEPLFTGDRSGVVVQGGGLILAGGEDLFNEDLAGTFDWLADSDAFVEEGTLTGSVVDLGSKMTFRLSPALDAFGQRPGLDLFIADLASIDWLSGVTSDWSVEFEFRATDDDPSLGNWTAWQSVSVNEYCARAIQPRLRLFSTDPGVTPRVVTASLEIDMKDRRVTGADLTVPASGLPVTFNPPFRSLKALAVDIQGISTGDTHEITAKSAAGFTVQVRDSGGTPVSGRTIDFIAEGFGGI